VCVKSLVFLCASPHTLLLLSRALSFFFRFSSSRFFSLYVFFISVAAVLLLLSCPCFLSPANPNTLSLKHAITPQEGSRRQLHVSVDRVKEEDEDDAEAVEESKSGRSGRNYSLSSCASISKLSERLKAMPKYSPRDSPRDPRNPASPRTPGTMSARTSPSKLSSRSQVTFTPKRGGDPSLSFDLSWTLNFLDGVVNKAAPHEEIGDRVMERVTDQWEMMDVQKRGIVSSDDLALSLYALSVDKDVTEVEGSVPDPLPEDLADTINTILKGTGDKGFFTIFDFTNMLLAEHSCSIAPPYPHQFSTFNPQRSLEWLELQLDCASTHLTIDDRSDLIERVTERWTDLDVSVRGYVTEEEVRSFVWTMYVDDAENPEEEPAEFPEDLEEQVESLMVASGKKGFLTFWDFANINASAFDVPFVLQPLSA